MHTAKPKATDHQITPQRAVLVVIDMQRGFVHPEHAQLVKKTVEVSTAWRKLGGKAVFTEYWNIQGSPYERYLEWYRMYGPPETDLVPEVVQLADWKLRKHTYGALTDELKELAKREGWETFLLAGLDTEACVAKTAFDILDWGYRPVLVADLCASSGGEHYHQAAVEALSRALGKQQILTSSQLFND